MKTAYVHDRIFYWWGAEQVFADLLTQHQDEHPQSQGRVFTLFSDKRSVEIEGRSYRVVTALPWWCNRCIAYISRHRLPVLSVLFEYRNLMVLYPLLVWFLSWKIRWWWATHVVISSFAAVKNLSVASGVDVTLYLHSPNQYIWENYRDYVRKFSFPIKQIFQFVSWYVRLWDKRPRSYTRCLANSHYTARCIHRYYGIAVDDITVQYPQLNQAFVDRRDPVEPHGYFLYIGRLVRFIKELDRLIALANMYRIPLLVMGSWPDEALLKAQSWDTITFIGHIRDPQQKKHILAHARGLLNITQESFGLVTAEALSCGVPVFGYARGWTPELMDEESGVLVTSKQPEDLARGWETFVATTYDRQGIQERFWKRYLSHTSS